MILEEEYIPSELFQVLWTTNHDDVFVCCYDSFLRLSKRIRRGGRMVSYVHGCLIVLDVNKNLNVVVNDDGSLVVVALKDRDVKRFLQQTNSSKFFLCQLSPRRWKLNLQHKKSSHYFSFSESNEDDHLLGTWSEICFRESFTSFHSRNNFMHVNLI